MSKQIVLFNNHSSLFSSKNIKALVNQINKYKVNKYMKELLLLSSINLLSPLKTSNGLIYQLNNFKNQGKIIPEQTKSKYLNSLIKDLGKLEQAEFINNIDNLVDYLQKNNVILDVRNI